MIKIAFLLGVAFLDQMCWGSHIHRNYESSKIQNVMDYGALGDGSRDDSPAFEKAWEAACRSSFHEEVVVPSGYIFLVNPTTFSGPCKSAISVKIEGRIVAPPQLSAWNKTRDTSTWLAFANISSLTIYGGGIIDGQGVLWWKNSCKINNTNPCSRAPTAMHIGNCTDVSISELQFVNSQQIHLGIFYSSNVQLGRLEIKAPEDSPNTDGIHLQTVNNANIHDCDIRTGDDCISITGVTSNVNIQKIKCGPGHGISIGSLGEHGEESQVEIINVQEVVFNGSQNGARIKTWQGGSGYAQEIMFANMIVNNVSNPIIIDQYYCDIPTPCQPQKSAVQIKDVTYQNITGTSSQETAVNFNCSESVACKGIVIKDIELNYMVPSETKSTCFNAFGLAYGTVYPINCLRK